MHILRLKYESEYNYFIISFKNISYCNAERYKCPPNEQYKY